MPELHEPRHVDVPLTEQQIGQYYAFVEAALFGRSCEEASRYLSDDFVEHGQHGERRRDEFLASLVARRDRFPDASWTIDLLAGAGALVICHSTMVSYRPDGARVEAQETAVMRFVGGRIVECWRTYDERR